MTVSSGKEFDLILTEGLESIGEEWFENASIREIVIPKSVKTIGDGAFYNCNNLASVILQDGLESIGDECFSGYCNDDYNDNDDGYNYETNYAPQIREIVIPKTVKSIGDNAFYECKNLIDVTLQEGLESIGELCFWNTGLKEISIPSTVTSIGSGCFLGTFITEVVIPKGVKKLEDNTF